MLKEEDVTKLISSDAHLGPTKTGDDESRSNTKMRMILICHLTSESQ